MMALIEAGFLYGFGGALGVTAACSAVTIVVIAVCLLVGAMTD